MGIKIRFDTSNRPELPTIVLARRNGDKIGKLDSKSVEFADDIKDACEITFNIHKYVDGKLTPWWNEITDFKLAYCVEWDTWFEIRVELSEEHKPVKTVYCTQLGHAELSQIKLFSVEINTENDIAREDYVKPTVFYDESDPTISLLDRILDKAPHYKVAHVDSSLKNIQRVFTFDNESIYDSFQKIAEEVNCLFVFPSVSDVDGSILRSIEVYDLWNCCRHCGYRGDFDDVCPECGHNDIIYGYGEDTTIFVSSDKIANELHCSSDMDSVKNCFKLSSGDELMDATIVNCNPNGTDYIWHISDNIKKEMSDELAFRLTQYDDLYNRYLTSEEYSIERNLIDEYNSIIENYNTYNDSLKKIQTPIIGYSSLMKIYYDTIDFELYLRSGLMPGIKMEKTNAAEEIKKLTTTSLSPVSVSNIDSISVSSADNAVLSMAKTLVNSNYKIKISDSSLNGLLWSGVFIVTNYSDEEDSASIECSEIVVDDNYENFVKQKIEKTLSKSESDDIGIIELFNKSLTEFKVSLKNYSLDYLNIVLKCCQGCIDILIEQGVSDHQNTSDGDNYDLYETIYKPYIEKNKAVENEISVREKEIAVIAGTYDNDGNLYKDGIQTCIEKIRNETKRILDFQNYIGDLWTEFSSFRREDKYENSNYISDGLSNLELITNANDFISVAKKEIHKASQTQYSISSSLKNLLIIKEFAPLVKYFKIGNWIRVCIDDTVYKLRLTHYSINYDALSSIDVEFSDVTNISNTSNKVKKILDGANNMASSYSSIKRQVRQSEERTKTLNKLLEDGLNTSNVAIVNDANNQSQLWNEHGMLFREYDDTIGTYSPAQLKIINSTLAITEDNWNTSSAAIGKVYYVNPDTNKIYQVYGVNAKLLVGEILLGKKIRIKNESGSLSFDDNGFVVDNGVNSVVINPNNKSIFTISNEVEKILSFDSSGDLDIVGNITAKSLTLSEGIRIKQSVIDGLPEIVDGLHTVAFSGEYDDLENKPKLHAIATSGKYDDLLNKPDLSGIQLNANLIAELGNTIAQLQEEIKKLEERVLKLEKPSATS